MQSMVAYLCGFTKYSNFYNDFEELSSPMAPTAQKPPRSSSISAAPDTSLLSSLRKRQQHLRQSSRELLENWTSGPAKSFAALTINEQFYQEQNDEVPFDWVRRISVDTYPHVACGGAHGSI